MALSRKYKPADIEPQLEQRWRREGIHHFSGAKKRPAFTIDTPPPTVSGHLHLGHVYSYSQVDFMARYLRMRDYDVLYPMGFDDNGLPTERLVERRLGISATEVGRQAFIARCLEISEEAEADYRALWQRLGLSIDWRFTYRTIDNTSRRLSQLSFLDLHRRGQVYRQRAPAIWCPECQTAIAQAELSDLTHDSEFVTLSFSLEGRGNAEGSDQIQIATTRPELLPACVAIFVHPDDPRYQHLIGVRAQVPLFNQSVPILADGAADPETGTGAVMCCTFGDSTDVAWWYTHDLVLIEAIDRQGKLTTAAAPYDGLTIDRARQRIIVDLVQNGYVEARIPTRHTVRVHERCDTPTEFIISQQWFVRVLEHKEALLELGERINWYPAHMQTRYRDWVEALNWDWCISRQRAFGVPFPVWFCEDCGRTLLADDDQLPVNPMTAEPPRACTCGSSRYRPERDIMDTWATSSLTPQLVGRWQQQSGFDGQPFEPVSLRPQAHEIIRTWAFYSIVKAYHHFGAIPWHTAAISGWGLAPEGMMKLSKSRSGGPATPLEMISTYSADAVRYWAASTGLGKDTVISEEKIQAGAKLANKLWNVARFAQRFLGMDAGAKRPAQLSPADRWILSSLQRLIRKNTRMMDHYDFATAKSAVERFFWSDLADNYLEMAKKRLYDQTASGHDGARWTLGQVLSDMLALLAPFMPFITDEIHTALFAVDGQSLHKLPWPSVDQSLHDKLAERTGATLVAIATAVRRHKSELGISLGAELELVEVIASDEALASELSAAFEDLSSVTRANDIRIWTAEADRQKEPTAAADVTVWV